MRRPRAGGWFGRPRRIALSIALAYLAVSILWILFSDKALSLLTDSSEALTAAQSFKGLAFVTATAALLYFLILKGLAASRLQEAETLETKERYRRLVEVSPDGIIIHSEGRVVFANLSAAKDLGYATGDDLVGKAVMDIVHPSFREVVKGRVREIMELEQEAPLIEEQFLRADGSPVDVEVAAAPMQFEGRPAVQAVIRNITGRKRAERIQSAIYRISEAANSSASLRDLFTSIRDVLGGLLPTGNFYIALYDSHTDILSFPYFVDQHDDYPPPGPPGRGLTAYVLRVGKPLLATPERFRELVNAGEVEELGEPSIDWLGVPLKAKGQTIGVLAVQTYDDRSRLTQADLDILAFVSTQVAMAIDRKESEEALRESERRFREMLETVQLISVTLDNEGRITFCNDYLAVLLGLPKSEVIGTDWFLHFIPQDQRDLVRGLFQENFLKGTIPPHFENEIVSATGSRRLISWNNTVLRDGQGGIVGTASLGIDVTASKHAEEALRDSEHRFRTLAETTSAAILIYRDGHILYANPAAAKISGFPAEEIAAMGPLGLVLPEFLPMVRESVRKLTQGESVPDPLELQIASKDGRAIWLELTAGHIHYQEGPAWLITAFDITERKSAEEALKESEGRFRTLAETTSASILIYQDEGFKYVNSATEAISGFDRNELLKMRFWEFVHPDHREMIRQRGLARLRGEATPNRYEFKILTKGGDERWIDFSAGTIQFQGRPAGLGTAFDITDRRRASERLDHLAHHDLLTGLPNRLMYYEQLRQAVAAAHEQGARLAVLFLNVDRFKEVNDSLGHDIGDLVLQALSRRLRSRLKEGDALARMESDEFTVLLKTPSTASEPARAARGLLDAIGAPLNLAGHEFHLTASVGISVFPEDGEDAETLMKNADIATQRAKGEGGNTYHFITSDLSASASERMALKGGLRRALDRGEFTLHFQPQVDLSTGDVTGTEALIRWAHPKFGLLLPDRFISLAEEAMVIEPLGEWVLRRACEQQVAWQAAGLPPFDVAVNLSAKQFQQRDLIELVSRVLKETRLDAGRLVLEITESTAMWDMENTIQMLKRLGDLGARIAIDDFGRGYSSLTYLKKFPIHIIKVDQSFVRDVASDPDDAAIVRAVIAMAHGLQLSVIAEGVETADQMEFLRNAGCDGVQGYFISKACPPGPLETMLRSRLTSS